eukprot:7306311-Prymnesium_polylepis.1
MAKAEAHRHQLHEAITLSLRDFVHAIHEAGGDGRYADKLRQAQQVHVRRPWRHIGRCPALPALVLFADRLS